MRPSAMSGSAHPRKVRVPRCGAAASRRCPSLSLRSPHVGWGSARPAGLAGWCPARPASCGVRPPPPPRAGPSCGPRGPGAGGVCGRSFFLPLFWVPSLPRAGRAPLRPAYRPTAFCGGGRPSALRPLRVPGFRPAGRLRPTGAGKRTTGHANARLPHSGPRGALT